MVLHSDSHESQGKSLTSSWIEPWWGWEEESFISNNHHDSCLAPNIATSHHVPHLHSSQISSSSDSLDWIKRFLDSSQLSVESPLHDSLRGGKDEKEFPVHSPCFEKDTCALSSVEISPWDLVEDSALPPAAQTTPEHFSLHLTLEWTHKRGKTKPDQYWVYCEDRQSSYARITLHSPLDNPEYQIRSKLMKLSHSLSQHDSEGGSLVCVEKTPANAPLIRAEFPGLTQGFMIEPHHPGIILSFLPDELEPLRSNGFRLEFVLKEDPSFPYHPQQRSGREVFMSYDTNFNPFPSNPQGDNSPFNASLRSPDPSGTFCPNNNNNLSLTSNNRGGDPLDSLENPMRFFSKFVFKNRAEGWFVLEMKLWYEQTLVATGMSDPFVFNNPRMRKPREFSALSPQEVKFVQLYSASSCSTQTHHDEDYWLHAGLQLNFELDRVMELISLANHGLDSWKRKISSCGFRELSTDLTGNGLGEIHSLRSSPNPSGGFRGSNCVVLYQWMGPCGTLLERLIFETIHISWSSSLSGFVELIRTKIPEKKLEHLYCFRGGTVTEICDSADLQSLLASSSLENPPKVILSEYSDFVVPAANLFYSSSQSASNPVGGNLTSGGSPSVSSTGLAAVVDADGVEFCFTVKDTTNDDIREVFLTCLRIGDLYSAIGEEFQKPADSIVKLCKSSTGARLTNDKNLLHLTSTDIILIYWE